MFLSTCMIVPACIGGCSVFCFSGSFVFSVVMLADDMP